MSTILVTGASGTLGTHVTDGLRRTEHDVHTLSRHPDPADPRAHAVDLRQGAGLDRAMDGVHTVLHLASTPSGGDLQAATHLIRAARGAGVHHLIYISIVGVDSIPLGLYKAKHTVEQALLASDLGVTILRATQFHPLIAGLCARMARLPVMPYPDLDVQPVDPAEVALRLVRLAAQEPAGRVDDLGGPRVEPFAALARAYLHAHGQNRPTWPLRAPGRVFAAFRSGAHLAPEQRVGRTTFEAYLQRTIDHDPTP
ncbi:SDR family oxidoreductase [Nocardiopsis sp. MG754419]|uniref:SDR family oxidoreductase n=1 Tax=Nocardiopsis sp. MG754419 TaxID=2259865 RepID=UPI001BA85082|nr:NAD(P)H-binding protein [Nocardiopsis sp. MG754419]MBR8745268.1 nucleoside-diphosphate sugar epimerase [Nocardiopsis sp. MG754419]